MEAASQLQIVYRDIEHLVPYARNARTHSDEQIAQLAASLREFGWTNPVLLDGDCGIIAGHGRVLAARKLGQREVPTIDLAHLSEAQRRAYVLADNKLAERAGWDSELLELEVADLSGMGFELGVLGFTTNELATLLGTADEPALSAAVNEERFLVLVDCGSEREQSKLFAEMRERHFVCKLMS
ncbi:ParB/Srx family N-terminal domain-containing protein [Paraburkholderia phymatum]|uniref:ParB domain protein nuclease n=1 Tax=Paraburkholderia phymatum (strain DSM 17167 / CIP 108236 / LMG 21445 / STM815) TaxID=391038 RepID=B2JU83_PARP8|nr:ParB/Srx family N-terminal domain-containing protein [Paraburkholderia phymatum]ACC76136.1 ParB domain protein nuclease [Paraburkholderia phymatum STM815]